MTLITDFEILNGQYPYYLNRHDGANFIIYIPYTTKNRSTSTLYYQLISGSASYVLTSPSNGKYNVIAGVTTNSFFTLTRTNPGTDITEDVIITLEVFSDSGYTTLISSQTVTLTYKIYDLESFIYQYTQDFSTDITGWSGQTGTIASVSATGSASLYWQSNTSVGGGILTAPYVRTRLSLPDYDKIALTFYSLGAAERTSGTNVVTVEDLGFNIYVNGVLIVSEVSYSTYQSATGSSSNIIYYEQSWIRHSLDLALYRNQTITLELDGIITKGGLSTGIVYSFLDGFRISASN
jgi:hypothetical protein